MSEPKPTYTTRPVVRIDPDGSIWVWLHGSRLRRLKPGEVSGSMGHVLAEGDTWLKDAQPVTDRNGLTASDAQPATSLSSMAHPANQPVKVEEWDAVEVVKRVRRIE